MSIPEDPVQPPPLGVWTSPPSSTGPALGAPPTGSAHSSSPERSPTGDGSGWHERAGATPPTPAASTWQGLGWKVLTVLSLALGTAALLPYLGVILANIMAVAAPRTGHEPPLLLIVATAFFLFSTAYPLGLLLSYGGAAAAWAARRPVLAFASSLIWVAWIGVCVALVALWAIVE